jgi:FixJ family two-component response regulator
MIPYPESTIILIDDDEAVRRSISLLLLSGGYNVEAFENAKESLASDNGDRPGCILLDIFLDGVSGLELQDTIRERFPYFPIIYITGYGDVPMSVRALKKGALNFLQKPIDDKLLFQAVSEAISNSLLLIDVQKERNIIQAKIDSLTHRELEILSYVIRGWLNKQIAAELNIAEHTVKLHRGKITEKLGVKSVPEMIYLIHKTDLRLFLPETENTLDSDSHKPNR